MLFGRDGTRLPDIDTNRTTLVKSKAALVRRLDTMTCNGCHQSRSLAGFHVLGNDRAEMPDVNALVEGISPHMRELLQFRRSDIVEIANANMQIAHVPFAERGGVGGYGTVCGLGDGGFTSWTCDAGLTCSDINGDDVGMCVPEGTRTAGSACEESKVELSSNPHKDSVGTARVLACALPNGNAGRCVRSGGDPGGFPMGMCSGRCTTAGKVEAEGICGVAVPSGFNTCVAEGRPFADCIAGGSTQYRRACDAKTPCGADYVCSAVPNAPPGVGACMPPYFIFQARVDGHLVND